MPDRSFSVNGLMAADGSFLLGFEGSPRARQMQGVDETGEATAVRRREELDDFSEPVPATSIEKSAFARGWPNNKSVALGSSSPRARVARWWCAGSRPESKCWAS